MDLISIITGIISLLAGIVLGKLVFAKNTQKKIQDAENQAQQIISEAQLKAETTKKERILEAKEKFVQLKAEHDKEVLERNRKISDKSCVLSTTDVAIRPHKPSRAETNSYFWRG